MPCVNLESLGVFPTFAIWLVCIFFQVFLCTENECRMESGEQGRQGLRWPRSHPRLHGQNSAHLKMGGRGHLVFQAPALEQLL